MRVGVIGLGVIGKVHIQVLDKAGIKIAALCDVDENILAQYKLWQDKGVRLYSDYTKMLQEADLDAVHICTPHYLHADMVVYALNRDINVLCEKPLCINGGEIDRILAAEKGSKAVLGVVLQNRYNVANRYVKDYLAGKKVLSAHGSVVWSRDGEYYKQAGWRGSYKTEGGGVMINQAIHTLDLVAWFCGLPDTVIATTQNYSLKGIVEVEDTAAAVFSGKADFTFFATNASKQNMPVEVALSTADENIKIFENTVIINDKAINLKNDLKKFGKECYGNSHSSLIMDFYDCLSQNKKFWIDGQEGANSVRLVLAMYKSRGEKVNI